MEYCHFSWTEARDLPTEYRRWFIARKEKELQKKREAEDKARGKKTVTPGKPARVPPKGASGRNRGQRPS